MSEFKSWQSYRDFARAVRGQYRYVWASDVKKFLETVIITSKPRHRTMEPGTILWRAQIGYCDSPYFQDDIYICDMPAPHHPERMKPLRGKAIEGRANPKGISYLYLSNKMETALSEVRPWIGSSISVGQFRVSRQLRVVDCFGIEQKNIIYFEEPGPSEREKAVWIDIDRAFSQPVNINDDTADYVPTQILAEVFKAEIFDGIIYRSAFGGGYNIVLFDIESAEIINCFLYEVIKINFDFHQAANPYFINKNLEHNQDKNGK